jgi:hypothetical protein
MNGKHLYTSLKVRHKYVKVASHSTRRREIEIAPERDRARWGGRENCPLGS